MSMLTTTHHGYVAVGAPVRARGRVVATSAIREGHSRAEIAALIGTLLLIVPFGFLVLLGL